MINEEVSDEEINFFHDTKITSSFTGSIHYPYKKINFDQIISEIYTNSYTLNYRTSS